MPPINMSRSERSSLKKILQRPRLISDIPQDHSQKFINHGLAQRDVMLLRITALGQVELLRQRFRAIGAPQRVVLDENTTRGSLLFSGRLKGLAGPET